MRSPPYPSRLLGERFDLDDELGSLTLVAPEAFHATIDQKHRREPALRTVHPTLSALGSTDDITPTGEAKPVERMG
jgi:hypothetical protein